MIVPFYDESLHEESDDLDEAEEVDDLEDTDPVELVEGGEDELGQPPREWSADVSEDDWNERLDGVEVTEDPSDGEPS